MSGKRLAELEKALRLLSSVDDPRALPEHIVELVTDLCGASRAAVMFDDSSIPRTALPDVTGVVYEAEKEWIRTMAVDQPVLTEDGNKFVAPITVDEVPIGALLAADPVAASFYPSDLTAAGILAQFTGLLLERDLKSNTLPAQADQGRDFVSMVTHQLRLPMTSISGYSDLLLSGSVGAIEDRQREFLLRIKRNVERMNNLVFILAEMEQLETGRKKYDKQAIAMGNCIARALASYQAEIDTRQQQLVLDVPADLPRVVGDEAALSRVLRALLANATRYTPPGGEIAVRVQLSGSDLETAVSDSGIGISQADQANVFTPFFRSEDASIREYTGWGLDLALAKLIVAKHDGTLTFRSRPGEGSTFTLTLPIKP